MGQRDDGVGEYLIVEGVHHICSLRCNLDAAVSENIWCSKQTLSRSCYELWPYIEDAQ